MYNICVFAGTSEGRTLVEFLSRQQVQVTACAATEYGGSILPEAENLTVSARRLPVAEIEQMLRDTRFDLVIDATHPYAQSITGSISSACKATATEYLRLLREASESREQAVYVADTKEAVEFLAGTTGTVLLTTGSKELGSYAALPDFESRVYARVLPIESSLASCREAGLKADRILAMQGPFTMDMNLAMLRFTGAKWLVTKDGGAAGGFAEKAAAAEAVGAGLVIIGRPPQREGLGLSAVLQLLQERFACRVRPQVAVVGIGPGSKGGMTVEVSEAIAEADCLIGAKRMLEAVAGPRQALCEAIAPDAIAEQIRSNPQYQKFTVVMSGDTGFFSGTKKLLPLLEDCDTRVLPGISSLSCLCSKIGCSYEDVVLRSLHGRQHDLIPDVRANRRVFILVGGKDGMQTAARELTEAGLGNITMYVGERLGYPEERITKGTPAELAERSFETLCVALIENDHPDAVVTHGLPDAVFQRGDGADGVVPMTKSEVRTVSLSKLQLTAESVCWDVGAGTGSVSIEMALQAKRGQVYAIERKGDALALLEHNQKKLHAENMIIVPGMAPEACEELPAPTHVFIGGSSGQARKIMELARKKNPHVRIVATAIALESIGELTNCAKQLPWAETEVVSMQVARDRKAGPYHLMTGQNPVYIFTLQAGGEEL